MKKIALVFSLSLLIVFLTSWTERPPETKSASSMEHSQASRGGCWWDGDCGVSFCGPDSITTPDVCSGGDAASSTEGNCVENCSN